MADREVSMVFNNKVNGLNDLDIYIKRLETIHDFAKSVDKGITTQLSKSSQELKNFEKNVKTAFSFAGIVLFTQKVKKLYQTIGTLTSKSASYLENMNLLDVAFNNNTKEADKFVNKLSEMYGLDESWGYRTVGIFKQLANAMGLANEVGDKLATTMTQFSIDISSLYNIDDPNAAVSILQSALAGQTKPARRLGADITQTTLQTTLDQAGINRYITSLSYAEKRLLIIASLLQQVSEANNDWGRTIESVANQTRILSAQWDRFTRALGNVFLPIIKTILPYLNAILMVLTEIISIVATLLGYKKEDYDFFTEMDESVIDFADGLGVASDNAKKLKQGLRGFDKLNNITTPSASSVSGGVGGLGVDENILDLFNKAADEYNAKLTKVKMRATEIRDAIMEWLGFTKQIDEETGKVSFKFEHITSGTVLGALAVGGAIYLGIKGIAKILEKLKISSGLEKLLKFFSDNPIAKIVGFLAIFEGVKLILEGILELTNPLADKFKGVLKIIEGIALVVGGIALLFGAWPVAIGAAIVAAIALLVGFIHENWDKIKEFFSGIWEWFNETVITPVVEWFSSLADWINEKVIQPVINFLTPIKDAIVMIFDKVVEIIAKIIEIFVALGKAFYDYVITPIVDFIKKIATWIYDNAIKPVIEWVSKAANWFYNTLIQPIINFFKNVGSWVYDNIIKPIWDKITWLKDKAIEIFKKIGTTVSDFISGAIKGVINGIFSSIENSINNFIKLLNAAINIINKIPGVDITKVSLLKLPRLKTGIDFVPNDFYPAYLDYGERVLTKEENQKYSALENQDFSKIKQTSVNPTIIVQVGSKELAKQVITDLQDIAKTNGTAITIGG